MLQCYPNKYAKTQAQLRTVADWKHEIHTST